MKKMLTIKEAADYSGMPYSAIWRFVKQNKIQYVKSGNRYYIPLGKLNDFLHIEETEESDEE